MNRDLFAPAAVNAVGKPPSVSRLSLRTNVSWMLAGNATYAGFQWLMLVALAWLGSPESVGQFTLGLAITVPVIGFTNLQLRVIQTTDVRREYAFADYMTLRVVMTVAALAVVAGIVVLSGYRGELALVVLLVGLAKSFESMSDVFHGLLQQNERMDRVGRSLLLKGPLSLLALCAGMLLTGRVVWAVAGLAIGWGLLFVCYDLRNGASVLGLRSFEIIRIRLAWPTFMRLGKLAFPLGFATLLISLNANIPRYFVQHQLGVRELGIFGALSALLLIDRPMVLALGESASPRLAQQFASRNLRAFQTLLLRLIGLEATFGAGLFLMALLAGPRLLGLVYGPEYAAQSNLFVWLAASSILGVWPFLWYGMTAARYFRVQAPLFLVVAIVTAIASALLIPAYGLIGSAVAVMAGLLTQVGGSVAVLACAVRKARASDRTTC